jgi:very-short-patch-repair endonuclease
LPKHRIPSEKRAFARGQRATMTRAEALLWRELLAGRFDGWKFRRQVPVGRYIVDFICHDARLIVELDGEPHAEPERQLRDAARDAWLVEEGFRVLRFGNDTLLGNPNVVLEQILAALAPSPAFR